MAVVILASNSEQQIQISECINKHSCQSNSIK